jgi:hypothetical protein
MKVTNPEYRREINCAIFHEMPGGQGHEMLRRFDTPLGLDRCEDWANRFCAAMSTDAGPGAWHNYIAMFSILESNLNLVQRLAKLTPFLREVSTCHNTMWQDYLSPQAWQAADGDTKKLLYITTHTIQNLVPKARELDAILADWPQFIIQPLVKSVGFQAAVFDYTLAAAYINQFPHYIIVMVSYARENLMQHKKEGE